MCVGTDIIIMANLLLTATVYCCIDAYCDCMHDMAHAWINHRSINTVLPYTTDTPAPLFQESVGL